MKESVRRLAAALLAACFFLAPACGGGSGGGETPAWEGLWELRQRNGVNVRDMGYAYIHLDLSSASFILESLTLRGESCSVSGYVSYSGDAITIFAAEGGGCLGIEKGEVETADVYVSGDGNDMTARWTSGDVDTYGRIG
ncbi:MAG: hypothetical protein ACNS63_07720 [Candidatus Nitrospinota bacterium M3_3B_026]